MSESRQAQEIVSADTLEATSHCQLVTFLVMEDSGDNQQGMAW